MLINATCLNCAVVSKSRDNMVFSLTFGGVVNMFNIIALCTKCSQITRFPCLITNMFVCLFVCSGSIKSDQNLFLVSVAIKSNNNIIFA